MPQISIFRTDETHWTRSVGGSKPPRYYEYFWGYRHKPEWDKSMPQNPLTVIKIGANDDMDWDSGDPEWDIRTSIHSLTRYSVISERDPRLYATVYTKALLKARDGAELGMNIIQARQTLSTFIQLSLLAASVVSSFTRLHKVGLRYLTERPHTTSKAVKRQLTGKKKALAAVKQKELDSNREAARLRKRLSDEIFILEQVAATLLAYRYGIAPIMGDLHKTHEIMCQGDLDPGVVRASAERPAVAKDPNPDSWFNELWTGKRRYSMRFVARVDNPNAFLMNKLGLINPLYWAWDSVPWSFVVDWWFPVGDFLNSFTASVGLTFTESSFTELASGTCTHSATYAGVKYSGTAWFSSKVRTVGGVALPPPTSVPYGNGLGVNRAQNALALVVQKLNLRKKIL